MNKLPEKLSDCIKVALADLEKVEKIGTFKINMDNAFYNKTKDGKCTVCFAGAIMSQTLNDDTTRLTEMFTPLEPFVDKNLVAELFPKDYDDYTANRLRALDSVRLGDVEHAMFLVDEWPQDYTEEQIGVIDDLGCMEIIPYAESQSDFKDQMKEIADRLAAVGL